MSPSSPPVRSDRYEAARAVLQSTFGYPDFRPPQRRAVQAVLSERDALIVLPTGGGKSLCYQVPALVRDGLTVVLSPLISLMKDQVDTLVRKGVSASFVNSTLSAREVADRMDRARDGSLKLLYLAPERLEAGRTLQALVGIGVSLLAVDEAHCISEWGHDFRPSYRRIGQMRARLGMPQTVALTATATPAVRGDIVQQLALRNPSVVVGGFDRVNLTYHVVGARTPQSRNQSAIAWLQAARGPAIVYAPTRTAVEQVTASVVRHGIRAVAYHGGLDPGRRQRAQDAFMQERTRVIVATSAFGMGIDKPDVRLVVHHAMPGSLEAYYQEAGRAGRDGQPSTCVLMHAIPDRVTHEFLLASAHPSRAVVERIWQLLCKHADANGFVGLTAADAAQRLPRGVGPRTAEAALRVLATAGACTPVPASRERISIRLLATPERIRRELDGSRRAELDVLRALWRAVGPQMEEGVAIDLRTLPSSLGGAAGLVPVIERLTAQQFVASQRVGAGVCLAGDWRGADRLPVDWRALARRRDVDLGKLDAMQRYAQTRHCRRAFVLRYFGDPEVHSPCDACDRCLGITGVLPPVAASPAVRNQSCPRPF
jgi:ATP-dependent DNA helicase RecQ